MLKAKDDEFHREFIKRIGIDDVHAREVGGTARDGQEPWLAGLGRHLCHQAGGRGFGLQDSQGRRGRDPGARRHAAEELARASARRQDHPQGRPRRHHRLLHQPRRKRQARGQEADPEGRTRQEHAAAAQSVADACLDVPYRGGGALDRRHFFTTAHDVRLSQVQGLRCPRGAGVPRRRRNRREGLRVDRRGEPGRRPA